MAKAELSDNIIVVETQWAEKELIKQVPGSRWSPGDKTWTVPLTWEHCVMLRGVFGEALIVDPALNDWAWPHAVESRERRAMRNLTEPEVRHSTSLYPFQEVGAAFMRRTRETLLADEMGTGKTVQVCAALDKLWQLSTISATNRSPFPALIVCPNSVKRSWATHVRDWTQKGEPYLVTGGAAARDKIIKAASDDPNAVVIINFESLRGMTRLAPYGSIRLQRCRECDPRNGEESLTATRCQVHPKQLNRIPFVSVIVDEAHRVKSPQAQQTRAVWAVSHQPTVTNRWALTGTPVANHPGDLWSILHTISPIAFPTKTHYVDRYCLQSWNAMGGLSIVGLNPAVRDEFYSLLDVRFRRMRKDVVLSQLPPKVRSMRWVEMTPKQRRAYDEFNDSLLVEAPESGELIAATTNLVAKLRQLQLSSGSIDVMPDGQIRMVEPSPKLDALEEILAEMEDQPVAVCAMHRQLIDLAAKRLDKLGITYGRITGTDSEYERDRALRDFQDGRIRVLLFTVAAGGVGLTMTATNTLVFLQRSWSMVDNKQAEDRVHRIGSERHESVHIIDIVSQDSIEERQLQSLLEKLQRLEEITRDRATADEARIQELEFEEERIMGSQL